MNRNLLLLNITGISLTALAGAHAENGFYVRADVGGTWTEDTELREYFGSVAPGSKVTFTPGGRFGINGGYQLTDWFAAEAQMGVMTSSIDRPGTTLVAAVMAMKAASRSGSIGISESPATWGSPGRCAGGPGQSRSPFPAAPMDRWLRLSRHPAAARRAAPTG